MHCVSMQCSKPMLACFEVHSQRVRKDNDRSKIQLEPRQRPPSSSIRQVAISPSLSVMNNCTGAPVATHLYQGYIPVYHTVDENCCSAVWMPSWRALSERVGDMWSNYKSGKTFRHQYNQVCSQAILNVSTIESNHASTMTPDSTW